MMTAAPAGRRGGVSRGVIAAAVTGTFALALGAFLLSFGALQDLARLAGVPDGQAWLWPLIVDGVILQATISVVALRDADTSARRFAWMLLAAGTGVSVAANITHAILTADERFPAVVAALVASVPPLVLVAMTHLTVELIRNAAPKLSTPPATPGQGLVVEAQQLPAPDRPALEAPGENAETDDEPEPEAQARTEDQPGTATRSPSRQGREANRREAARLAAQGLSYREIARRHGVHPTTVARWLNAPDSPHQSPEGNDHEPDTDQP
ncbi:DUF2637 domain-containing protein [Leucobacter allii]|uniref:DUF2637 domain-containing protein n=1 Tax=Leucobacter allii TaxID=2932247 RepID=A0ABY4FJP7_9MICO|nr:DUF2637 domain-containing protein [Leucobacter allii]UOQ56386.1 DUF2637 domain-containing protein [Leucobacter allii]